MVANDLIAEDAPAKINLALHVTGQREDGYHLLESLVGFTDFGDRIYGHLSDENSFQIEGPFGEKLQAYAQDNNLIIRARDALADYALRNHINVPAVNLTCEKNLPLASGLGGGSADAAATMRLLIRLWRLDIRENELMMIALQLGADVPMCITSKPLIAKGIGEDISPITLGDAFPVIIINPLISASTPEVFGKLANKNNESLSCPERIEDVDMLASIIKRSRNDLQSPAIALIPEIGRCLEALDATDSLCARMSGSGASCFALYEDQASAQSALGKLKQEHSDWFIVSTLMKG